MFGIGAFYKAYRSLISKRHPEKNSSPNKNIPETEDKFKSVDQTHKTLNDKEHDGKAMNKVHDIKYNVDGMKGGELASFKGFLKKHSIGNYITSMPSPLSKSSSTKSFSRIPSLSRNPSLSRSASQRSQTATQTSVTSRFLRSKSRKNANYISEEGPLSRSSSMKGSTNASLGGGSLSRSTSRKGSTPIMYSNSNGLMKPPSVEKTLECTLEELCFGCTKRITITRDVVTSDGQIVEDEETLTIKVKPGWRKGTKITFKGMGNETPGTDPADIIFVIAEKRHPLFRREGDDLELVIEVPLVKSLTGCTISIPLLGGEQMSLTIKDIIQPGCEKIISGLGMPKSKEEGNRGNLRIEFLVQFPTKLTQEQRATVISILQDSC